MCLDCPVKGCWWCHNAVISIIFFIPDNKPAVFAAD